MNQEASILLLNGNLSVALCLGHAPGLKVHALGRNRADALRFSRFVSSYRTCQEGGPDALLESIEDSVRRTGADVLFPVFIPEIRFVSEHRAELGRLIHVPPTPEMAQIELVEDKWELWKLAKEHGIPCPATAWYRNDLEAMTKMSFPVLLKPIRGAGGHGIRKFMTPGEMIAYGRTRVTDDNPHIVQSFVEGFDIDCSVLCKDGRILAMTIQRGVVFRGSRFSLAQAIQFVEHPRVREMAAELMAILNWNGVAHIDMRYDTADGEIKVIEINPRYWTSLLGSLAVGVNFPHLHCLSALGREFAVPVYRLESYVNALESIRQILRVRPRQDAVRFSWSNTALRYGLSDPIAQSIRLILRGSGVTGGLPPPLVEGL